MGGETTAKIEGDGGETVPNRLKNFKKQKFQASIDQKR